MTKNRPPAQPMTPNHPRWHTFIARLSGPEGCHFREDETGNLTWDCGSGQDKSKAIAILKTMPDIDLEASLAYFDQHGGYCDCEIVFNVEVDQVHETNYLGSSQPPAWMETLVEVVTNCLEANSPMGPLGYRYLTEADLYGAKLYETKLRGAKLREAVLLAADLRGAELNRADLFKAILSESYLHEADLTQAQLGQTKLCGARLNGASLISAHLFGTDLSEANLCRANLTEATMINVELRGAKYNNATVWPPDFDPKAAGAINVDEASED